MYKCYKLDRLIVQIIDLNPNFNQSCDQCWVLLLITNDMMKIVVSNVIY